MSCRSRRVNTVLATLAAAVLGGFLTVSPAQAAPAAPQLSATQGADDFVRPVPSKPQFPEIPCLPPFPGLPCVIDIPDDFVWPIAPRN
ncbi:hypothetical protein [Streptomyces sp. NPDC048266]|uniref:hypothetical protein n=1 Tax=unclassified Streptomyces TaxID=2593676 RepID=UPI0033C7255F